MEAPPSAQTDNATVPRDALLDMAVESWRLTRTFLRVLNKLDAGEQGRYRSKVAWFLKKLDEELLNAGFRLVNLEGHPYDPGMAASAINIQDFGADDVLVVDQMLEPVILGPESVARAGTVTLRKVQ